MSYEEEDSEPSGAGFQWRWLFVFVVFVAMAGGWILTVVDHHNEMKRLRNQLHNERETASRVLEYVYMTTADEEVKRRLLADWEKALKQQKPIGD